MRVLLIIAVSSGVIGLALAVGLLRPGLTSATLERYADRSVASCMHEAGFGHVPEPRISLGTEQARTPQYRAVERCWSEAAKDQRFERLALTDPIAVREDLREEGFLAWRCAEEAGYKRTTQIPLSGPAGYPLQLAAGNFRVGSSYRDLERFYGVAAECSGDSIDAFRWSDGSFSRAPAEGVSRCIRHDHHGSGSHAHGCYAVPTYPVLRSGHPEGR